MDLSSVRPDISVHRLVPQGPWSHQDSSLSHLGLDLHPGDSQEPVFSSAWLWNNQKALQDLPRVAITFPTEWQSLLASYSLSELASRYRFDFWVFQNLSATELNELRQLTETLGGARTVIAPNHLMDWKNLLEDETLKCLALQKKIFLSFLKPVQELDPFLKPQEVLWEMETLPREFPILIYDASSKETHSFYETLNAKDHELVRNSKSSLWLRLLKFLDKTGLPHFALLMESLLGLFFEGPHKRAPELLQRAGRLTFEIFQWAHLSLMKLVWYSTIFRLLNILKLTVTFIFYSTVFKLWVFLRFKTKPIASFFYYRLQSAFGLFKMALSFIWYNTVFKVWVLIRFKLKPVGTFIYFSGYKLCGLLKVGLIRLWYTSVFKIWVILRFKLKPIGTFLYYSGYRIGGLLKLVGVRLWYVSIFKVWTLLRFKLKPLANGIYYASYALCGHIKVVLIRLWYSSVFKVWVFLKYKSPALAIHAYNFFWYQVCVTWLWYKISVKWIWHGFCVSIFWHTIRYKTKPALLLFLYPLRKIYWFSEFQYQKRVKGLISRES